MRVSTALALVATGALGASAQAVQGFNYGSTFGSSEGQPKQQSDFEADFKRAQNLQGTSGFNAARLYTMIQAGTTNNAISAIPAAISTNTKLLLGMWASAGQDSFNNELAALKTAIGQYGSNFTDLVVGLSIGSEDLYRITPTGIENKAGVGAGPDVLVNYINQVKKEISGTPAAKFPLGHVDTWTAWVNGSNKAVIEALDWVGFDGYPYFESTEDNTIENGANLFYTSFNATVGAAGGKPVWLTETGWPVSGSVSGKAVASTQNAETYWQEVACPNLGKVNTFWYTLQDSVPSTPNPSFGIIGSDLNSEPLYDLSCKASSKTIPNNSGSSSSNSSSSSPSPSSSGSSNSSSSGSGDAGSGTGSGSSANAPASGSSSGSSSGSPSSSAPAGSTTSPHSNSGSLVSSKQSTAAAVLALVCLVAYA